MSLKDCIGKVGGFSKADIQTIEEFVEGRKNKGESDNDAEYGGLQDYARSLIDYQTNIKQALNAGSVQPQGQTESTGIIDTDGEPNQRVEGTPTEAGPNNTELNATEPTLREGSLEEQFKEYTEQEPVKKVEKLFSKKRLKNAWKWFNKDTDKIGVLQETEVYTSSVRQVVNAVELDSDSFRHMTRKDPELGKLGEQYLEIADKSKIEAEILAKAKEKKVNGKLLMKRLNRVRGNLDNLSRFIAQSDVFKYLSNNLEQKKEDKSQELFQKPLDELTEEQVGVIDSEVRDLQAIIENNLGSYMRNSYRAYTDKKFKFTDHAIKKASDALLWQKIEQRKSELEGLSEAEINQKIGDEMETMGQEAQKTIEDYVIKVESSRKESDGSFNDLAIPTSPFKQRKGVPEYIADLLGKRQGVYEKAMSTVDALAKIKYGAVLSTNLLEQYGDQFASKEQVNANYELESNQFSPLHGMYVNKEFKDIITPEALNLNNLYFKVLKAMRKSKTVYTAPTIRKNITGHLFMNVLNGYGVKGVVNSVKLMGDTFKIYANKGRVPEYLSELMRDGKTAGVLGGDVVVGDLLRGHDYLEGESKNRVWNWLKKFDRAATRAYGNVDDVAKLRALSMERERQADIFFNKKYENLTRQEKNQVLREAGEVVKNTIPTWSRLPKVYNKLYRFPFGDFISFKMEAMRTHFNSHIMIAKYYRQAMNKDLPVSTRRKYAKYATHRAMGAATMAGLTAAIASGMGSVFDDEEVIEYLEPFKPQWMKGHTILYNNFDKKNKKISGFNATMENPYGFVYDTWMEMMKSGDIKEAFSGEVLDFFRTNMAVDLGVQLYEGQDHYGKKIYEDDDPDHIKAQKSLAFALIRGFTPPNIVSQISQGKQEYREGDFTASKLGERLWEGSVIRDYEFSPVRQFGYALREYGKKTKFDRVDPKNADRRIDKLDKLRVMVQSASRLDDKLRTNMLMEIYDLISDSRLSQIEKDYIEGYATEEEIKEEIRQAHNEREEK